jgi:histidyl-tRNA synthetase
MFRRERPQKGRFRQFHQFGVEVFGRADAACDAEVIIMIDDLRRALNLELETQINSLGCAECRPAFRAALLEYGRAHFDELCEDCHQRLERNPLRLLDCKIDVKLAATAPTSLDYLCADCRQHFATVERILTASAVAYVVNPRLVRGLDYYMRTTFEFVSGSVGSQSAVVAGGRYDGLVEALGGAPVAGIGFAAGVERLALAVAAKGQQIKDAPQVAMVPLGDAGAVAAISLARRMRARNLQVELLSPDRGLKALMRRASKIGARFAVIIGENEVAQGKAQLRDLKASAQREVAIATAGDTDQLINEVSAAIAEV